MQGISKNLPVSVNRTNFLSIWHNKYLRESPHTLYSRQKATLLFSLFVRHLVYPWDSLLVPSLFRLPEGGNKMASRMDELSSPSLAFKFSASTFDPDNCMYRIVSGGVFLSFYLVCAWLYFKEPYVFTFYFLVIVVVVVVVVFFQMFGICPRSVTQMQSFRNTDSAFRLLARKLLFPSRKMCTRITSSLSRRLKKYHVSFNSAISKIS